MTEPANAAFRSDVRCAVCGAPFTGSHACRASVQPIKTTVYPPGGWRLTPWGTWEWSPWA